MANCRRGPVHWACQNTTTISIVIELGLLENMLARQICKELIAFSRMYSINSLETGRFPVYGALFAQIERLQKTKAGGWLHVRSTATTTVAQAFGMQRSVDDVCFKPLGQWIYETKYNRTERTDRRIDTITIHTALRTP